MTATLHRIPHPDPDAPTTASATVKIAAERHRVQAAIIERIVSRTMYPAARDAARAAIREARAQLLVLECRL